MLTFRISALVLGLSLLCFIVLLVPLPLLTSLAGVDRLSYSKLTGSMLEMRFENLSISGNYLGTVIFRPEVASVLTGTAAGSLLFSNDISDGRRHGQFYFERSRGDHFSIKNASFELPVAMQTKVGPLSGIMVISSEAFDISLQNGCRSGDFSINTNVFDVMVSEFDGKAFPVSGHAICTADGTIVIEMTGSGNLFSISISGTAAAAQNWNSPTMTLTAVITPSNVQPFRQDIAHVLEAAGLSAKGQGYSLPLSIRSVRN